jgi:hypothetical protein
VLPPDLEEEWDEFYQELSRIGIYLHNIEDQLLWAGGDSSGLISVRDIYSAVSNTVNNTTTTSWCKHLWILKIPLKVKLFIWLADNNRISTWDNLQKKGWNGPSQLCFKEEESMIHIIIQCQFARQVWNKIAHEYHFTYAWTGISISDCFAHWTSSERSFKFLPPLVIWYIWMERTT